MTHAFPLISRSITLVLMGLCLNSTATAAGADTYTARDMRVAIPVTASERNQVLFEMRELLHGMVNLHAALAKEDFKATAIAAKSMGPLLNKMPDTLKNRAPEEFSQLGIAMRESFDTLARDAESKRSVTAVQLQLSETMTYCSGCHDAFRFDVRARVSAKK